ncbi:MAG: LysM peptidoglycan-binding domain-containing protein [Actinobacteria bacterium]|nr:LysM peptidoglycan-binding domain-containing protein [Actinomycetota bacterium]
MNAARFDRLRPMALALSLVVIVLVLHLLGTGPLAPPPIGSVTEVTAWATDREPVVVGLALFRLAAMVVAAHLALTSSVAALGHLLRRPGAVRVADTWTLPPFRGALRRAAGLGISAAAVLSAPVPGAQASVRAVASEPGTATMRAVDGATPALAPTADAAAGSVTLRIVDPPEGTGTATVRTTRSAPPAEAPRAEAPAAERRHVVRPGDHLWGIATEALAGTLDHRPTDAEVAPYWRRVVAANPQLADPDLLHPGDEVVVPAPLSR